jgi:hypothetical protein
MNDLRTVYQAPAQEQSAANLEVMRENGVKNIPLLCRVGKTTGNV